MLAFALPTVLPVRSTASMVGSGVWQNSWYKDEIGWPELANQTARAWNSLPATERADRVVLAGNYGEASALEFYGPGRGLPQVLSGEIWQRDIATNPLYRAASGTRPVVSRSRRRSPTRRWAWLLRVPTSAGRCRLVGRLSR